ncbi:hypothetical protein M1E09_01490 [Bacillus sp. AK031]
MFKGISTTIDKGEVVAIIGPSGSGDLENRQAFLRKPMTIQTGFQEGKDSVSP